LDASRRLLTRHVLDGRQLGIEVPHRWSPPRFFSKNDYSPPVNKEGGAGDESVTTVDSGLHYIADFGGISGDWQIRANSVLY
jgi:hypothetical protein